MVYLAKKRLPFGGVGHSGDGSYHGIWSFDSFSHKKSIVKKSNLLDLPFRFAPYKDKLQTIIKILN